MIALLSNRVFAFDAEQVYARGNYVISAEGAFGQADTARIPGNLQIWNLGARFSLIPFGTTGAGILHGALEAGLEPFYQRYRTLNQNFGGLAIVLRYYFLSFGRFAPYVEGFAAAGAGDLRLPGYDHAFSFLLNAGFGVSYLITDNIAPYVGFRLQHVSNADLQPPNDGFQSFTALFGVSLYLSK